MKKSKRDEVLNKTSVDFDKSICLTDDQLEAAAGGGKSSSVSYSLCGSLKNGEEEWTASVKKNVFFGLIPFTEKKTFATEEEAQNWLKGKI